MQQNFSLVEIKSSGKKKDPEKDPYSCPKCDEYYTTFPSYLQYIGKEGCQKTYYTHCPNCGADIVNPYEWGFEGASYYTPKTQKARGIVALTILSHPFEMSWPALGIFEATNENWKDSLKGIEDDIKKGNEFFVRPCPPSPEHGFVESRICKTLEEIEVVRQETLKANPDSEILLMHPIDAKFSAIWTPSMLSVGPGHDGATSGKNSFCFPLAGFDPLTKDIKKQVNIPDDRDPYVELVSNHQGHQFAVQLRHGPKLEKVSANFVPVTFTPKEIIKTNNEDLLEWAKVIRGIKGKPGVVVYHPGGTPVDHYSVHCRENDIPIVTTFEPKVGTEIPQVGKNEPLDPHKMLEGLAVVDKMSIGKSDGTSMRFTALALFALHYSAVLRGEHSFWIGAGVAALLKLGPAALRGEARHANGASQKHKPDIYNHYGKLPMGFHRAALSRVTQVLHYGFGDPEQPKSFGGKTWALCGASLCPVFNSVRDLAKDPTPENASKVVEALNIAINQAHNGGWWLNKFLVASALDSIQKGDIHQILSLTQTLFAIKQRQAEGINVKRFIENTASWPETTIRPLKWRSVSPSVAPGAFQLTLKASTIPMPKVLTVPLTGEQVKQLLKLTSEIVIKPGEIYLETTEKEKVVIWEEKPLVIEARKRSSDGSFKSVFK